MQTLTIPTTATTVASDAVTLTADQAAAREKFAHWFHDLEADSFARIAGYAGTGKTTLLIELLKWAIGMLEPAPIEALPEATDADTVAAIAHLDRWDADDEPTPSILLCAPTHAALNVMRRKVVEAGIGHRVTLATIQSACAFKMTIDDNGNERCHRDKDKTPEIGSYPIVAIDEIQMLNSDIVEFLKGFNFRGARVLLLGDPAQPEPVGESSSSAFEMPVAWQTTLTEVVRYSGKALELATWLRDDLRTRAANATGILAKAKGGDRTLEFMGGLHAIGRMTDVFTAAKSPYDARIVCSTNAAVDQMNARVRVFLERRKEYEIGETLIANKPIKRWDAALGEEQILVNNGAVLTVKDRFESPMMPQIDRSLFGHVPDEILSNWQRPGKCLYLECEDTDGEMHMFPVLTGQTLAWHTATARQISQAVLALPKRSEKRRLGWRCWHEFLGLSAPVKYGYASTTHKATGLTFETAFVAIDDFQCWKIPSRNRLIYTALTRAANTVVLSSAYRDLGFELDDVA